MTGTKITRALACAVGEPLTVDEYASLRYRLNRRNAVVTTMWRVEHDLPVPPR